ncbi:MAG TPA: 3-keto-5-aminohexanoate cleavage protein [Mycobacteriales bacterium]|nr:3-keto-5-aminohexanoate cleavage protein [Mycobacteriales bacterium]
MGLTGTAITVAPTGAETLPDAAPGLPATLDDLVATAGSCAAAGASVIHVHVRDGSGRPSLDLGLLTETVAALRGSTDLVVQLSTGGDVTDSEEDRLRVVEAGPDAASCTLGTVNFGDGVFLNRWPFVVELHTRLRDAGVVPEYECFDLGHVQALHRLLDRHGAPFGGHVHVDLVMGVPGGMPGTPAALVAAVQALPEGCSWSATGVGRFGLPVALTALAAGGHLRVGMEDTLTYAPGEPVRDNAQLVSRAAELATLAQRPPLPPAEVRRMLGIPDRAAA